MKDLQTSHVYVNLMLKEHKQTPSLTSSASTNVIHLDFIGISNVIECYEVFEI